MARRRLQRPHHDRPLPAHLEASEEIAESRQLLTDIARDRRQRQPQQSHPQHPRPEADQPRHREAQPQRQQHRSSWHLEQPNAFRLTARRVREGKREQQEATIRLPDGTPLDALRDLLRNLVARRSNEVMQCGQIVRGVRETPRVEFRTNQFKPLRRTERFGVLQCTHDAVADRVQRRLRPGRLAPHKPV